MTSTALVGEDADAASVPFPVFSDSMDDEVRKALPTAPESLAFDLGRWLVECSPPEAPLVKEASDVKEEFDCDAPSKGWRRISKYARCSLPRPDDKKATTAPSTDIVERRKRLLDAAASLGAEHDSLVQEARGRLGRRLRGSSVAAPFRFNRRKLQAHLRDEPMRAYVHYSQPAA